MTAMGVYDQIKKAFQDIVAPEIHVWLSRSVALTTRSITWTLA